MTKSAVVRGASKAASIWSKIDAAVKAKGGTEDALDILDKKDGVPLIDVIADILVRAELKTRGHFPIEVDYAKSLADIVKVGKYDYANNNIVAKNFPIEGTGTVQTELVLVHFDRDIKSEDAVQELEQMGLRPATLLELLALGAKYPDLQREYPIMALGSSWAPPIGNRYVPCLDYSWSNERGLGLERYDGKWPRHCRFAAVRK